MKKNLIFRLLLLSTLSVSLNSCRTDEMMTGTEQAQKEKIAFFERFEQEKKLSKNASSTNYALPFGNSMLAYFEKYPEKKTELENKYGIVDLKVSSQDIGGDEGDNRKLLFFPMLKDGKVTAVIAGVINAERDYLYFDVHQNTHSDVFYLINKFQQYYNSRSLNKSDTTEIDEIIITVTRPIKLTMYDVWSGGGGIGSGGHDMGGGPGDYGGGGGGASTPNQPTNTNPCEQTKKEIDDPTIEAKIKDLKDHLASEKKGEKGWRFNKDGTSSETTDNSNHSVTFGDPSTMNGGYHNHTGTKVDIFSATDIAGLIEIARYQSFGNIGTAFMGMIAPNGIHYVIHFNGSHGDLPTTTYTQEQRENWELEQMLQTFTLIKKSEFKETVNGKAVLNSKGLEQIFFDTLSKMGLDTKITLQKVDNNNKVLTKSKNTDGLISETPCL